MRLILKNLWAHRRQNGWIFAEIAIITALSWAMVDFLVVNYYGIYFCNPAGDFEKDHLCVWDSSECSERKWKRLILKISVKKG